MKNKLFYHMMIDISIASGFLLLDELRKRRKEIKKLNKKIERTQSSIQGIEFDVELMEQSYKELINSIKTHYPKES
ncbi:hypothetical protein [Clostridium sp. E02]|uniref:hypothetical protein n=1 Tax=Clostridium sp. E02 TaxID=2487134 RepID=UPI000F53D134|nr:hypothetical protein [Clostridium sp. E02]